jgi:uncharacterized protein
MKALCKKPTLLIERDRPHLLRIDRGEKIMSSLLDYIRENKIKSGFITGIGATSSAELGWFDPVREVYDKKVIDEPCEITSLVGNIAWFENDPIAHVHITLGKSDYSVVGGHMMEATVGVTCEIWIMESWMEAHRSINKIGGLKLLDI